MFGWREVMVYVAEVPPTSDGYSFVHRKSSGNIYAISKVLFGTAITAG